MPCQRHAGCSPPVHMHNDPRRDTALQRRHVFQEKLNLRRKRMLAAQHYHVDEAVREGVPAEKSHAPRIQRRRQHDVPHVR